MSPKLKRQRQFEDSLVLAREKKLRCCSDQDESMIKDQFSGTTDEFRTEPEELAELLVLCGDALDTEDEDVDPSFDLDSSLKSDMVISLTTFVRNGLLISTMKIEFHLVSFSAFSSQVNLERAKQN